MSKPRAKKKAATKRRAPSASAKAKKAEEERARRRDLAFTAINLRRAGVSVPEIARELRIDAAEVEQLVREALIHCATDDAEQARTLEVERLNSVTRAMWSEAMRGNVFAARTVIESVKTRAALLGLVKKGDQGDPMQRLARALSRRRAAVVTLTEPEQLPAGGAGPSPDLISPPPQRNAAVADRLYFGGERASGGGGGG